MAIDVLTHLTPSIHQRIKRVQLNAKKKDIVDTDALVERYRKEIEDFKNKLSEREAEAPSRSRRLSAREQIDESKAMKDLSSRIQQLTKLILTSQTVDENKGDELRPGSPSKVDFDMSPYQLQQELLATRLQLESQATQILSLETALPSRPELSPDASETEKDKLIAEQAKTIRELEIVVRVYEDNLGEPLRAVREDVEKEWMGKLEEEVKKREEKEAWAAELGRQLDKEKKLRIKIEEERRALASFICKFDSLRLGLSKLPSKLNLQNRRAKSSQCDGVQSMHKWLTHIPTSNISKTSADRAVERKRKTELGILSLSVLHSWTIIPLLCARGSEKLRCYYTKRFNNIIIERFIMFKFNSQTCVLGLRVSCLLSFSLCGTHIAIVTPVVFMVNW
ncbi:hypothetical protein P692DRAFT_20923682 [Suillus brevipes Sb2]|nr:hypothetical protein P692DRAFT_20923682 [Suillus brevipes Sb2]